MKRIFLAICIILCAVGVGEAQTTDTTTVDIQELFFSPTLSSLDIEPAFDSRLVIPKVEPIYKVASIAFSILHGDNIITRQFLPVGPTVFTSARPNTALEYSYFLHRDYPFLNHRNRFLNAPLRLD